MSLEPYEEANFERGPVGPSSKGCCKILNGNSCGSGSLVGKRDGKSLVLTNAHVAGTRIGKTMSCTFPYADNDRVTGRVIMAGYSNRVMMDWAVLELDREMDLPHTKLMNEAPEGGHYTAGYPRCQGPYFQKLQTRRFLYSGTVWLWQPNSIGGQSGSAVHSMANDLQYGLLTWSWGGDGAGQTVKGIWFQYANRSVIGFPRPEGLVELNDNTAEDLEEGFFQQTNITTLPIWAHLDDDNDDDGEEPGTDPDEPVDPSFAKSVLESAKRLQQEATDLAEKARKYSEGDPTPDDEDQTPGNGPLFGL